MIALSFFKNVNSVPQSILLPKNRGICFLTIELWSVWILNKGKVLSIFFIHFEGSLFYY